MFYSDLYLQITSPFKLPQFIKPKLMKKKFSHKCTSAKAVTSFILESLIESLLQIAGKLGYKFGLLPLDSFTQNNS